MKKITVLTLSFFLYFWAYSQSIVVEPYLQDAYPTSIRIMWETSSDDESIVEWGLTNALGSSANGTAETGLFSSRIHDVLIDGLQPDTRYYYRVITGSAISAIYDFITPPLASAEMSFRMVAMSDMQRDGSNPNKYQEIVHDGVLTYMSDNYGADLAANLDMVIIPGDLVVSGFTYSQWENHFFAPSHPLFAHVPIYPVPGNHEANTPYYFKYFHLPENGTAGYEEHWWYKDHSNVRLIGLDSNPGYRIAEQLTWLSNLLTATCTDSDIDFVFAQLHHPHKSELWLSGETDYTGDVKTLLENFSTNCSKPSIHFYGHTHGYSRGQSQNHQHLMVNVATAGGSIDYWGEYAQADYPEFSVTQDEYGFVVLDVDAGTDPQFTLKRISRGDENTPKSNELTDEITIRFNNDPPVTPIGLFPVGGNIHPECIRLIGSNYTDPDGDEQGSVQWQIATDCNDFTNPLFDSWMQHENWYYDIDLNEGIDLNSSEVSGLSSNTAYCWRVRYRDKGLVWSDWSLPVSFSTGQADITNNLLVNPSAESGATAWTTTAGNLEILQSGECAGTSPHTGTFYFAPGGLCSATAYGEAFQAVDVSAYAQAIDANSALAQYGGWLSDYNGSDIPALRIDFLDANGGILGTTPVLSTNNDFWTNLMNSESVPPTTRTIHFVIMGTRNAGSDNDSYLDDLDLRLSFIAKIQVNALLEGAYNPVTGLMRTDLRADNLLPLSQPYNRPPWNYNGPEKVANLASMPMNVVDWVLIEIRDVTDNAVIVEQKAALLLDTGEIIDANAQNGASGISLCQTTANQFYYVSIKHRNHLAVLSANSIELPNLTAFDFTVPTNVTDGMNQLADLGNGEYGLRAGDFDSNGILSVTDFNLYSSQTALLNQYVDGDCSLDKSVTVADFNLYLPNSSLIGVAQIRY